MTVETRNDLEHFRDHLSEILQSGAPVASLESVVANWRTAHPDAEELAALEDALEDSGRPFEEFDREFCHQHDLTPMKS